MRKRQGNQYSQPALQDDSQRNLIFAADKNIIVQNSCRKSRSWLIAYRKNSVTFIHALRRYAHSMLGSAMARCSAE